MKVKLITLMVSLVVLSGSIFAQSNLTSKDFQEKAMKAKKAEILEQQKTIEKHENAGMQSSHSSVNKEAWDVLFTFSGVEAASPGIETDGTNFYTTTWNAGNFHRYDMDGSNPVTFTVAGASNVRDMAYDGTYFYGAAADMNLFQMDLASETLVSTITATCTGVTGIRHISYDPTLDGGNGGFWIGNWSELGAIAMDGSELVAGIAVESAYGSAYDPYTDPTNPRVLVFQQTGSGVEIHGYDVNTATMTGLVHDASDVPGFVAGDIAGGMCTYEEGGVAILAGNIQQDPNLIFAYELASTAPQAAPAAATNLTATADATGALTVDVEWNNPALQVNGDPLTELTAVELFLNDETTPIYTSPSNTIGGLETYTATVTNGGMNTFTVIGTNTAGAGLPASVSVFVGTDVAVTGIGIPNPAILDDVYTPMVSVANFGGVSQTFDVTLTNGTYNETVNVSVAAAGTEDVTFPDWTATPAGATTFTATAADPGGDIDLTNNTMDLDVDVVDYVLFETFNTEIPATWTVNGDWMWVDGTGNSLDGTGYALIDSDAGGSGGVSVAGTLESPEFDASGTGVGYMLDFDMYYNYLSDEICQVEVWDGTEWQVVEAYFEDLGAWGAPYAESIDISQYANAAMKVRFNFDDLTGWNWYWAVDNVTVSEFTLPAVDLIATDVAPVGSLDAGDVVTPSITVYNYGTDDIANFDVEVAIGSVYTSTKTVTTPITSGSTITIEMDDTWTADEGTFSITGTVTATGDENPLNNVITYTDAITVMSVEPGDYTGINGMAMNSSVGEWATFDPTDGALTTLVSYGTDPFPMAAEYDGEWLYFVHSDASIARIDGDGTIDQLGAITGVTGTPTGLAYDSTNDVMYVVILDAANAAQLCTLDGTVATLIGTGTDQLIIGLDLADDGMLYGPALGDDQLYQIDPATGATTAIGPIGFDANFGQDVSWYDGALYTYTCGDTYAYGVYDIASGAFVSIAPTAGDAQVATMNIFNMTSTYTVDFGIYGGVNGTIEATVDGTAISSGDEVEEGSDVLFTATPDAGFEVANWWYNGDSTGLTGLSVIEEGLASDIEVLVEFGPDGISEVSNADVNVYPNPSTGFFNIEVNGTYEVTVMSAAGNVVYTGTVTDNGSIDLTNKAAGIYFLQLKSDNKIINQRIMVK